MSVRRLPAVLMLAAVSLAVTAPPAPPAHHAALTPIQNRRRGRGPASGTPQEKSPAQIAEASTRTLHGHADGVLALAFSTDGQTLASASADHSVILWNTADGSIVRKLAGNFSMVASIAFSPDGKWLLSGDYNGGITRWNLSTGQIQSTYGQLNPVMHLAFLGDDLHFVSNWGPSCLLWSLDNEDTRQIDADDSVNSILYTPEQQLITADGKANIIVWDPKTGARVHQFSRPLANHNDTHDTGPNWIMGMSLLQNGDILLCDMTGFWDWNRKTDDFRWIGKNLFNLAGAFANDRFYCGGTDGATLWFRDMSPDGVSLLIGEPWHIHAIAASPKNDWLAIGGGGAYENNRGWRTAGPTDVRLLKIDDIISAMAAQKEKSADTPDHSAISPNDPTPLPWKKIN